MNIHEKIMKIAEMAGVLRKNKKAFNFNYTPEDEILAKVTAGMKKYGVQLVPEIAPGSMHVEPYEYQKFNKQTKKMEPAKELMVYGDMKMTWINTEDPTDRLEVNWAFAGQKDDLSQAFGGGLTYANRYFLLKALQIATVEDDPDNYRSKQREAEDFEKEVALRDLREQIVSLIGVKLKEGVDKEAAYAVIAEYNGGKKNPNSIKTLDAAQLIIEKLNALEGIEHE